MKTKLISHEIPLALIDEHQDKVSDYMYVLLHKMIEDPVYAQKAYDYKKAGHKLYLDNSCFELGASLDNDLLYEYCEKLNPDVVILPDVLGDKNATIKRTFDFLDRYPHVGNYGMAVAQGSTRSELMECYATFRDYRNEEEHDIFMLGFPFVFSWVDRDPASQTAARIELLRFMHDNSIIDKNRCHHLLGTWQANEFSRYRDYDWIHSIDTSNPVMAAIDGSRYSDMGLFQKPKATFDSAYHLTERDIDMFLLYNNVETFRRIVNGQGKQPRTL